MGVVRDFVYIVYSSKVKQDSERGQRFDFNGIEVKEDSECSQRFHLNVVK